MKIEVHFDSLQARDEFMAEPDPKGVSRYIETCNSDGGDYSTFIVFLNLAKDIGVGVFSAWLYDKIKSKPCKIEYRRKEIQCEQGEIRRVIEEHIRSGGDDDYNVLSIKQNRDGELEGVIEALGPTVQWDYKKGKPRDTKKDI